jgi:penicillin G amidase
MIWKFLRWVLVLVICIILGFYITFRPTYYSQVTYKGRKIPLTRDEYGIATIHASSMEDYLYGLGTLFAEDRLFQMSFRAYAVQGRMSELLGEKPLNFDRFMREINLKKWAEKRAARLKAENMTEYIIFSALVNGVNDRVAAMHVLPM